MRVILAQPRGFCAGVVRAIAIVERAIEMHGPGVYVRHEIVHNRRVVEDLERRGAIFVEELDQVPPGAVTVFSAHGVSRQVEADAAGRGLNVLDATCPLVSKVHNEGRRYAAQGRAVILIGHAGHPEVVGTLGQIGAGIAIVATWLFSRTVTERPVTVVLAWLTVLGALLSLPTIGMYYGLHEWTERVFGFGARGIALVDTSLASPFAQLSMVPMLTLIAVHAPPGRRATWFALMASLMNLALQAGTLGTKYLNQIFVVERGAYGELGHLMITATAIGLVVPLLTIVLVGPRLRVGSSAVAQKEAIAP